MESPRPSWWRRLVRAPDFWPLLAISVLSFATRFVMLGYPKKLVFDEAHFGYFTNEYCCRRIRFHDIHPPLGKLMLAGWARLVGYHGHQEFRDKGIGYTYMDDYYLYIRCLPAFIGSLIPPATYASMRLAWASRWAATLAAAMILFDNATLIESRLILTDGILFCACQVAVAAYLRFDRLNWCAQESALLAAASSSTTITTNASSNSGHFLSTRWFSWSTSGTHSVVEPSIATRRRRSVRFTRQWWLWLWLAGTAFAAMLAVKWVAALATFGLCGLCEVFAFLRRYSVLIDGLSKSPKNNNKNKYKKSWQSSCQSKDAKDVFLAATVLFEEEERDSDSNPNPDADPLPAVVIGDLFEVIHDNNNNNNNNEEEEEVNEPLLESNVVDSTDPNIETHHHHHHHHHHHRHRNQFADTAVDGSSRTGPYVSALVQLTREFVAKLVAWVVWPFVFHVACWWVHFQILVLPGFGSRYVSNAHTQRSFLARAWEENDSMYHGSASIPANHPFQSWYYQWPVNWRGVRYWDDHLSLQGKEAIIHLLGNPLVWWMVLVVVAFHVLYVLLRFVGLVRKPAVVDALVARIISGKSAVDVEVEESGIEREPASVSFVESVNGMAAIRAKFHGVDESEEMNDSESESENDNVNVEGGADHQHQSSGNGNPRSFISPASLKHDGGRVFGGGNNLSDLLAADDHRNGWDHSTDHLSSGGSASDKIDDDSAQSPAILTDISSVPSLRLAKQWIHEHCHASNSDSSCTTTPTTTITRSDDPSECQRCGRECACCAGRIPVPEQRRTIRGFIRQAVVDTSFVRVPASSESLQLSSLTGAERRALGHAQHERMILFCLGGWVLNLLPFVPVTRQCFLYHYIPALMYGIMLTGFWLDRVTDHARRFWTNRVLFLVLFLTAMGGFIFFAPISYGFPITRDEFQRRLWLPRW